MTRGTLSGVKSAAVSEAAISGVQEGVVNTATQIRDQQLGLRNDFSLGEVGLSAGLGAATGGVVGGAIGVPSGIAGARSGIDRRRQPHGSWPYTRRPRSRSRHSWRTRPR